MLYVKTRGFASAIRPSQSPATAPRAAIGRKRSVVRSVNGTTEFPAKRAALKTRAALYNPRVRRYDRVRSASWTRFSVNELTAVDQWDSVWAGDLQSRLPSAMNIATRNQQHLLKQH